MKKRLSSRLRHGLSFAALSVFVKSGPIMMPKGILCALAVRLKIDVLGRGRPVSFRL